MDPLDLRPISTPSSDNSLTQQTPLEVAGQVANRVAGDYIFERYLSEKSVNTVKRHARDLTLFADYLRAVGVTLPSDADFQHRPSSWQGVTWGLVEGFVQWQLQQSYAVTSVNARLSTVRTYAHLAVKAGVIERTEGVLIQSVKGYSRQGGLNVDERREQTRKQVVSYSYTVAGQNRPIQVTRRSTKKRTPTLLSPADATALKTVRNSSQQAWRDALLACLLIDHGLRASEVALLKVGDVDLTGGTMRFFRPKVKGTQHEWTTHQLTKTTHEIAKTYIETHYPTDLKPDGPLIVATTRLLKSGEGGHLLGDGLNRVKISERIAYLGKQLALDSKLSAHDCRHTCATQMARLGYAVDELMAWFGWSSAQTAMRYVASADVKERYRG